MAWIHLRSLINKTLSRRQSTSTKKEKWLHFADEIKDGIEYQLLTPETLPGALKVIRRAFLKEEPFCVGLDIFSEPGAVEEYLSPCYDAAKHGMSFVAKDLMNDEVVGVIFNNVEVRSRVGENYYEKLSKNSKYKISKALFDFNVELDSKVNVFELYNVNSYMELMYLATLPEYRKKNVCKQLLEKSLEQAENQLNGQRIQNPFSVDSDAIANNPIPELATALATSSVSQRICKNAGFHSIHEVKYKDLLVGSKRFSDSFLDTHQSCQVVVKRLNNTKR